MEAPLVWVETADLRLQLSCSLPGGFNTGPFSAHRGILGSWTKGGLTVPRTLRQVNSSYRFERLLDSWGANEGVRNNGGEEK